MGTDLRGTNLVGLEQCAKELGFVSQAIRVDRDGFLSDFTLPCIANIITKEGLSHFVVIFKKSKRSNDNNLWDLCASDAQQLCGDGC